jgi:hypothetical protein
LPAVQWGIDWEIAIDTSHPQPVRGRTPAGEQVRLSSRALIVLRHWSRSEP